MLGMHFHNVSVFLNPEADAYVHLAMQALQLHAEMCILQSWNCIRDLSKM